MAPEDRNKRIQIRIAEQRKRRENDRIREELASGKSASDIEIER